MGMWYKGVVQERRAMLIWRACDNSLSAILGVLSSYLAL